MPFQSVDPYFTNYPSLSTLPRLVGQGCVNLACWRLPRPCPLGKGFAVLRFHLGLGFELVGLCRDGRWGYGYGSVLGAHISIYSKSMMRHAAILEIIFPKPSLTRGS